jgi:outer membrane protein assembly factor BamA
LQGSISISYSAQDRSIDFTMADPWLFDRPLYGSVHFFHRRSKYEDFTLASSTPSELTTAGIGKLGFTIEQMTNTTVLSELGFESICFREINANDAIRALVERKFQSGNVLSMGASMIQDMRNHPTHPTMGYLWNTGAKVGIPYSLSKTDFGFVKWDIDFQWYAALIDEYDLVFRFHTFLSAIHQISNYAIPYRELYHIGGPATVRGFLFGQIGPMLLDSSLGAKKALVINAELLFPIRPDGSIRGVLFYDGGAGWDTPDSQFIDPALLRNNRFDYRHAIGFGVRLTHPTPVSIDIGFKLDRRKRLGESLSEVHFNMTRDF